MGWTHDYRDLTQQRGADDAAAVTVVTDASERTEGAHGGVLRPGDGTDPRLGIPRIIRRRARWVSARLRHPRGR